ncbi:hypothetical protein PR202_gb13917 [Eleusine coracana subsp. coracana]|uniref:Dof zinc finger protein n=1 Tax=Eleusine coracana subsp. coracana TaxID=191504 RepID=A0AAV5EU30_ELECO|nr:hypothetical protein QOZ80_4BG0330000 [Eleusine coracana subsp. coracana]GJN26022.1 hypothetical protein PR202_gb13917 [Eleusine coracana subsp. coracana]
MAPAASILAATSAAAAGSKRPADSEPEQLLLPADDSSDNSALPQFQVDDEATRSKSQSHEEQPKKQQLECPRCHSTNTKFCYYNNYSTAQPRHFCRACRRYWTHGGTLRDVPVGGATRRANKRRIRLSSSADELPSASSACSPPPAHNTATTTQQHDADIISTAAAAAFPFLSDGSYYLPPQLDLGVFAATAAASFSSSWPSSVIPADFYPWDDGTVALGDIAGMDLITWPPPAN